MAALYTIYSLNDPFTKAVRYIGYTSKPLKIRLNYHYYDLKKGVTSHKTNWLKKLTELNSYAEINEIETVETIDKALEREMHWISKFEHLTNSTSGGEKSKNYLADVRLKMSINRKGKAVGVNNPMFGVKREDLRLRNLNNNPSNGKGELIGKILKEKYNTPEYRLIHRQAQNTRQGVLKMDMEGNTLISYDSLREAAIEGYGRKEIVLCCKGTYKQHKGFKWGYAV